MVKISDLAMPKKKHAISNSSLGLIKSESLPHPDLVRQKYKITHLLCYTLTSYFGRFKTCVVKTVQLKHPVHSPSSEGVKTNKQTNTQCIASLPRL